MTDVSDTKLLALVAVVFLYILARMIDQDVTPEQYIERRELVVHSLLKLPVADGVTYAELSPETEALMSVAQEEGWLQMEWFLNVTPPRDMDEMELDGMQGGGASRSDAGRNLGSRNGSSDYIGLGTMLQDATDYLGERQRADYNIWRSEIMARIKKLEAAA
jgi:origin recognition complex subunit 6